MAPNSLSPASAVIAYHTPYGAHKMTIPTKEWLPTSISGTIGSYINWNGSPVDASVMWNDFIDALVYAVKPTTLFDSVTIYTQATPTSENIPRGSSILTQVGTSLYTGLTEAQSLTYNFKTVGNGDFKLVLLDAPSNSANGFNAQHPADFAVDTVALWDLVASDNYAFSGRDDTKPSVLRKITFDLNDKLQKAYKMSA